MQGKPLENAASGRSGLLGTFSDDCSWVLLWRPQPSPTLLHASTHFRRAAGPDSSNVKYLNFVANFKGCSAKFQFKSDEVLNNGRNVVLYSFINGLIKKISDIFNLRIIFAPPPSRMTSDL